MGKEVVFSAILVTAVTAVTALVTVAAIKQWKKSANDPMHNKSKEKRERQLNKLIDDLKMQIQNLDTEVQANRTNHQVVKNLQSVKKCVESRLHKLEGELNAIKNSSQCQENELLEQVPEEIAFSEMISHAISNTQTTNKDNSELLQELEGLISTGEEAGGHKQ